MLTQTSCHISEIFPSSFHLSTVHHGHPSTRAGSLSGTNEDEFRRTSEFRSVKNEFEIVRSVFGTTQKEPRELDRNRNSFGKKNKDYSKGHASQSSGNGQNPIVYSFPTMVDSWDSDNRIENDPNWRKKNGRDFTNRHFTQPCEVAYQARSSSDIYRGDRNSMQRRRNKKSNVLPHRNTSVSKFASNGSNRVPNCAPNCVPNCSPSTTVVKQNTKRHLRDLRILYGGSLCEFSKSFGISTALHLFDACPNQDEATSTSLPDVGCRPTVSEVPVEDVLCYDEFQNVIEKGVKANRSNETGDPFCSNNVAVPYVWPRTSFYGVVDGQFEQLCRQLAAGSTSDYGASCAVELNKNNPTSSNKKRNRVIFCRICEQFKPRSTRARFQSCDHIACYDCVRIALHVEFWAVKNYYPNPPRAACPVCRKALDWSTIKPYIVLSEESQYCPVLTLAGTGKDIPPNTPSHRSIDVIDEQDAQQRIDDAKKVVNAFFPQGVAVELLVSDVVDYSMPAQTSTQLGCAQQLFGSSYCSCCKNGVVTDDYLSILRGN